MTPAQFAKLRAEWPHGVDDFDRLHAEWIAEQEAAEYRAFRAEHGHDPERIVRAVAAHNRAIEQGVD